MMMSLRDGPAALAQHELQVVGALDAGIDYRRCRREREAVKPSALANLDI